jgi:mono/diheme cytochrome c family protein
MNPASGEDDASVATPSPPTGGIDAGTPPADCSRAESEAQRILSERCASCHDNGASQGGFSSVLEVDALLRQGRVVPNDPAGSPLFRLVEAGAMPKGGPRLSADEVAALRAWIACGASAPGGGVEDDAGVAPRDDAGAGPPDADDDDDDDVDEDIDEDIDEAADADEDLDEAQEEAAEEDDD